MSKRILVTGANRGIGLAICRQLLAAGHRVVMTSRKPCEVLAGASWHELDVTSDESAARLAEWVHNEHGALDGIVNNAGVALDGFDAEVARVTIDTNFFGPLRVTDALLPHLAQGARIVMVSSGMGDRASLAPELRERFRAAMSRDELVTAMLAFVDDVAAGRHQAAGWPSSAYRVSKIGVTKLAEIHAQELAADPRGIRCNAACPGWVRTDMGGRGAPRSPEDGARTPVWLVLEAEANGGFFRDQAPASW